MKLQFPAVAPVSMLAAACVLFATLSHAAHAELPPPDGLAEMRVAAKPADASAERPASVAADTNVTRHRTMRVNGVDIFYREAGRPDAPVVVLLHGFPSSSHMFRNLIPALADHYRVIAPDYPAFGQSAMPDRKDFAYGFATFAELMDGLLTQLGAQRYALYVMDYGAPVGFRLALKHPERVTVLVVQNGNAYSEGLREFWDPIKAYWREGSQQRRDALRAGTTLEATKFQYTDGVKNVSRIDPASWTHDQALLDRPGDLSGRWRVSLPARSASSRASPPRHGALCAGGQGR